jgi:hypothetical protein
LGRELGWLFLRYVWRCSVDDGLVQLNSTNHLAHHRNLNTPKPAAPPSTPKSKATASHPTPTT